MSDKFIGVIYENCEPGKEKERLISWQDLKKQLNKNVKSHEEIVGIRFDHLGLSLMIKSKLRVVK